MTDKEVRRRSNLLITQHKHRALILSEIRPHRNTQIYDFFNIVPGLSLCFNNFVDICGYIAAKSAVM